MPRPCFSIDYSELGRAPTGEILRFIVWAAWWTGEPCGKPWRAPDATGRIPATGPGVGTYGINYEAEVQGLIAADDAIRTAMGEGTATYQIDDAWARAARRAEDGKVARYQPSRTACRLDTRGRGFGRPLRTPAREWCRRYEVDPALGFGSGRLPDRVTRLLGLTLPFTRKEVQRAYRRAISRGRLHPDQGGDADAFKEVTSAQEEALAYATG